MAYRSRVFYAGTGAPQTLAVPFPILDVTHVHVYFDDVEQGVETWDWATVDTITLTAPASAVVEFRRQTGLDPLVTFSNASLLNEDEQNKAARQALYLIEESIDGTAIGFVGVEDRLGIQGAFAVTFVIDGGDAVIAAGQKGYLVIPFDCTITAAYILADAAGTAVVDVWKSTTAGFPPVNGGSITGNAPLTLSAAALAVDATLTGWTKSIHAGDILAFNVDSNDDLYRITVTLVVVK